MANYDGPLFSITPGTYFESGFEANNLDAAYWTTQPTFVQITGFGSGGSAPTTPEGDPIYGYGWGLSG